MLKTAQLYPESYTVKLWKNGQGQTRIIAIDNQSPFRWRLSAAKLFAQGPFSAYPGYDRILVLLNGGPITLVHRKKDKTIQKTIPQFKAHPFKGEWETEVKLETGGDDFNVFTLQKCANASVYPTLMDKGEDLQFPLTGTEHFIFCVQGTIEILEQNNGERFTLTAEQTLRVSRDLKKEYLNLRARGMSRETKCLWIVVRLR